jgi:hypothetical protein
MSATRPTVYTNQFRQSVAPGSVDLQIAGNGFFTAVLSGLQTTPLVAGARVKLDAANTQATMPQVVAAADNEDAIGIIITSLKKSIFAANIGGAGTIGDIVEVGCLVGPCIWQVANAAVAPGQQLEAVGVTIAGQSYPFYQPLASGKLAGIALDPALAQNSIFRMFVVTNLLSA